jgi:hypothetical protein
LVSGRWFPLRLRELRPWLNTGLPEHDRPVAETVLAATLEGEGDMIAGRETPVTNPMAMHE